VIDWLGDLEAGTWTGLVSGVLTAVALGLTAVALRGEIRQRRLDQRERERVQASSVAAWFDETEVDAHLRRGIVYVRNVSASPVFDVSVFLDVDDIDRQIVDRVDPLRLGAALNVRRVLGPDSTWNALEFDYEHRYSLQVGDRVPILEFTDSAGRRWRRDSSGELFFLRSKGQGVPVEPESRADAGR
jgi:hypothetical protein